MPTRFPLTAAGFTAADETVPDMNSTINAIYKEVLYLSHTELSTKKKHTRHNTEYIFQLFLSMLP
jgi:hypothetical protein